MATDNVSGGPRGPADRNRTGRGAGGGRPGERGRGDRGDRGRREGRDQGGGGAGYRVVAELSVLEKALSKTDFAQEKGPLTEIVKSLRSMRIASLEQLDLNTRGRMITTLLRVARQPKPAPAETPAPSAEASAPTDAAPATEGDAAPPAELATSEAAPPSEAAPSDAAPSEPADAASSAGAAPETAIAAPAAPVDDRPKAYADVMFLVGSAWRAVGEKDRAEVAYALSGRPPPTHDEPVEAAPVRAERPPRDARGAKPRSDRPARPDRPERRPAREGARPDGAPLVVRDDWQQQVQELEEKGRTRDAARIHEGKQSFAEASRLFEVGGDLKSALRAAGSAKDVDRVKRFIATMKPEEWRPLLEKAGAYEVLMELYVSTGDFDNVARLYERARQFDQAALAWERAAKFGSARKAFERAHDAPNANRMRKVEAQKLVERGDRLGAAMVWMSGGDRPEALQVLADLPGPKAFRFMQRAKLEDEAKVLAERELEKAKTENKPGTEARWLELLGQTAAAAEAWEKADRKDRAFPLYEKLGDFAKAAPLAEAVGKRKEAIGLYIKAGNSEEAARLASLPPPEPRAAHPVEAEDETSEEPPAVAPSENATDEAPSGPSEGS